MFQEPVNGIAIELDILKRLMGAARLSGFSNPEAAEDAAEDDLAPWRTLTHHPRQVELTVEAAQQISAAALQGLAGVQDGGDQAWKTLVVADVQHVARACRQRHRM